MRHGSALLSVVLLGLTGCGGDDPAPPDGGDPALDTFEVEAVPFDCPVDLSGDYTPDPRMMRWPYYTAVTHEEAVIQFGLAPGQVGQVEWGVDGSYGQVVEAEGRVHDALVDPIQYQTVHLTGLDEYTDYCFRVTLDGEDLTGPLAFKTAPKPDSRRKIRFLVMGDYGSGNEVAQKVYDELVTHHGEFDFWVTTGDNAYGDGDYQEWEDNVFRFYRDLLRRVPYFPVPGNHDYGGSTLEPMLESLELPRNALRDEDQERYYSFDWGPVHFTMADSERSVYRLTPEPDDDMMDWMRADLAAAQDRPWRVGVWHQPAYMTQPGRSVELGVILQLIPTVEEYDVDLVLQGHNHAYERFMNILEDEKVADGVSYITTGGGGAGVYPVRTDTDVDHSHVPLRDYGEAVNHFMIIEATRCTMTGRAIDWDGRVFDTWTLERC